MFIGNLTLLVLAGVLAGLLVALLRLARRKARGKACVRCGGPSAHGYSKAAKSDAKEIVPLCLDCLLRQLDQEYRAYDGRAVVVQPVAELPCYVFRTKADCSEPVKQDLEFILARLEARCHSCGQDARYAWVNALEPGPVAKLPTLGIKRTLLIGTTAHPVSLCGKCAVERISHSLSAQEGGYLEVCAPRGSEDGLVSGMGY